ncbi:Prenylcysteine lyase-domain-containing protein [Zopfochytrium polystomum]|nr:Prenylcysteine lyase-domain-containing protein [Zopfochytrium polystomum]
MPSQQPPQPKQQQQGAAAVSSSDERAPLLRSRPLAARASSPSQQQQLLQQQRGSSDADADRRTTTTQDAPRPRPRRRGLASLLALLAALATAAALVYFTTTAPPAATPPAPPPSPPRFTTPSSATPRIAVVGLGAAGASTAYFLATWFPNATVTAFERSLRVGGRAHLVDIPSLVANTTVRAESGASMFVDVNRHLLSAAREFGLALDSNDDDEGKADGTMGVFDGTRFVYRTRAGAPWRNAAEGLWRWGAVSMYRGRRMALDAAARFARAYEAGDALPMAEESVEGMLERLGLDALAALEGRDALRRGGVGEAFVTELIESLSRVNYAQNLDLNAAAALVSLVPMFTKTMSIKGGNELIFKEMALRSLAEILMNRTVTEIAKVTTSENSDGVAQTAYAVTDSKGVTREFDAVVLAVPNNKASSSIKFTGLAAPKTIDFIHLHVTFVTGVLNPEFFNLPAGSALPSVILTTATSTTTPSSDVRFNSIGVRHAYNPADVNGTVGLAVTKLFSHVALDDAYLARVYSDVRDVRRYQWDSYPVLRPPVRGDGDGADGKTGYPDVVLDRAAGGSGGVVHVNAFEAAVSTMETETVAALNAVGVLRAWFGE